MKRFIDLGHQLYLYPGEDTWAFAWYDTIYDKFEQFGGNYTWNSWNEFESDLWQKNKHAPLDSIEFLIQRYKNLYPKGKP